MTRRLLPKFRHDLHRQSTLETANGEIGIETKNARQIQTFGGDKRGADSIRWRIAVLLHQNLRWHDFGVGARMQSQGVVVERNP